MSFVSRLRMANMFPVNSDLGNARINIDGDEIDNIIAKARSLMLQQPMQRSVGMQMIGNRNAPQQPMRFGGVFDSGDNPGREINARAGQDVRDIYESYKRPLNSQVEGPSNDELYAREYFDRKNKEKVADAAKINAQGNANYKQAQLDNQEERLRNEGERINLTKDKNKTQAELDQAKFDLFKSKTENEKLSQETLKKNQRDSIVTRAQAALEELNRLVSDKDELTPRGSDAFGGVNNMISKLPWSTDSYDASTTRERLKNLLTLDLLGEMKAQSKTGATGFGQMNLRELGVLENAASRLSGKLSDTDAPAALKDVRKYLNLILADEPNSNQNQDFEILIDPNGIPRQIPKDKVEEALKRGARRQ